MKSELVNLDKICAFYLNEKDENSRNVMEELREERKDFEALKTTMLRENASNEKEFFKRKARDAKIIELLFPLSIALNAVSKEQVIVISKAKYDDALALLEAKVR